MKNILFIHQSADLYGSDKTLLFLVNGLNKKTYNPIVVIPNKGPLFFELQKKNIKTIIAPVLNIHKNMFTLKELFKLPYFLIKSIRILNKELKGIPVDIIQSNTTVVLLGAIYSKLKGIKHFWHIHEIVEKPQIATKVFPFIVFNFSDFIIFNSKATKENFCKFQPSITTKSIIIYNGISRENSFTSKDELSRLKEEYDLNDNLLLGLVGRINNSKGHLFLLKTFKECIKQNANIKLIFIGSVVKGKEYILSELEKMIEEYNLQDNVVIIPFQNNIWKFWDLIDIVIVPSIIPESFGLVALEAMLAKKPVIASNLGGLKEVVVHNKTGFLFEPNNLNELEKFINDLINNYEKRIYFGEKGYEIAIKNFSLNNYINMFETKVYG